MSTATEEARERESKVDELMEDVPFARMDPPPSELAPETPLTREAVIHLRAAAAEVSRAYGDVHALLDTVERALSEPAGGEKVFSEEERMNLGRLVRQAQQKADHEMQRPVFERGRGERPHGGVQDNGGGGSAAGAPATANDYDHPRGVFHQKYGGPNGDEVLVAVDRSGRSLVRTFVPDDADRDAVVRTMKRLLRHLEGPEPVGSEGDSSGQGDEVADALFDESPSGRGGDPLDAFEAVRRDTLEDAHMALLIATSIVNQHVDDRAWDTLGTVRYLEEASCDLEDALGLDRNEVEELVNEASVRADELLEGDDSEGGESRE